MNDVTNELIVTVLRAVLAVVVPVLAAYVARWFAAITEGAKARLGKTNYDMAYSVICDLVKSAEQRGLTNALLAAGEQKKDWVMSRAAEELEKIGMVNFPLETVSDMIEAALVDVFNGAKLSPANKV